jgi:hypothetical protein
VTLVTPCHLSQVIVSMLCLLVARRPSRTDPYNTANIISHVLMLVTLVTLAFLANPVVEDDWLTPERVGITLAVLQARARSHSWVGVMTILKYHSSDSCEAHRLLCNSSEARCPR